MFHSDQRVRSLPSPPDLHLKPHPVPQGTAIDCLNALLFMKSLGLCDAAAVHCLFKAVYLHACAANQDLLLPPPGASDVMINEVGAVLCEHLSDSKLRSMIENSFVRACALPAASSSSSITFLSVLSSAINCSFSTTCQQSSAKVVGSCANQHPMTLCSSIPLSMMQSSRGWTCSVCSKSIRLFQIGVWFCETCSCAPQHPNLIHPLTPPPSFTVCTACQPRYMSVRTRENFQVGQVVMLIPAEMGDYRQHSDAAGGPLVLGQQEPIEQVSDNRIRWAHAHMRYALTPHNLSVVDITRLFPSEFVAGGTTVWPSSLPLSSMCLLYQVST